MTTPSRWWFAAFIVVVFLAGTSVGVIVDRTWLLRGAFAGPRQVGVGRAAAIDRVLGNGIVDVNVRRLRDRVGLTPEQEAAARPIVQAWVERVRALQQTTRETMVSEADRFEAALEDMSPALSPEQRERLVAFRSELLLPAPARGRGRPGGVDGSRGGRGGAGREGPARPGGPGRE